MSTHRWLHTGRSMHSVGLQATRKDSKLPLLMVLLLAGLLWGAAVYSAAAATTRTVCASGCDFTLIQDAINAASAGDTISILDAVHTEAGIVVDRDLTIQGQGAALTIVQAATSAGTATDRVFKINGGVTATIKDMTIRHGNFAVGGGISNDGTLTITNSTFSGNSAIFGGGIFNNDTVTITNSTFSGNSASLDAGGIFNNATMAITNSTFANNTARNGGGINNGDGGNRTLTITNSTFANNTARDTSGGIRNFSGSVTLRNTIVANSTAVSNCDGPITDGGFNLQFGGTVPNSCGATIPTADPKLGPLANNGGLTQTMALQPGSAAIDAGDDAICAAAPVNNLDQRGVTRPQAMHCDIGAYEALAGTILLREVTTPASVNTNFAFTAGGGLTPTSFILAHSQTRTFIVPPGLNYSLSQNNQLTPPGWHLASATCDNGDAPSNIIVNENQTVTCTFTDAINQSDLQLTKQGNPNPVPAGQKLTYTLTVTNLGPDAAAGVTVTDHLPTSAQFVSVSNQGACSFEANTHKVTCSLGNVAVGAQIPIFITVIAPTAVGQIDDTASVLASTNDPNLLNNLAGSNIAVVLGPFFDMFQADQGQALNLLQGNTVLPNLQSAVNALKASNSAGALAFLTTAQGEVSQVQGLVAQLKSLRDLIAQILGQAQLGKSAKKITQQLDKARKALEQATDQLASCAGQIAAGIGLLEKNDASLLKGALSDAKLALQSCKRAVGSIPFAGGALVLVRQLAQKAGVPLAKDVFTEPVVKVDDGQITLHWTGMGELELFDLSGKRVLALKSNGSHEMKLPLMTEKGEPLANGVYLYIVTTKQKDGTILRSEIKKLVILR